MSFLYRIGRSILGGMAANRPGRGICTGIDYVTPIIIKFSPTEGCDFFENEKNYRLLAALTKAADPHFQKAMKASEIRQIYDPQFAAAQGLSTTAADTLKKDLQAVAAQHQIDEPEMVPYILRTAQIASARGRLDDIDKEALAISEKLAQKPGSSHVVMNPAEARNRAKEGTLQHCAEKKRAPHILQAEFKQAEQEIREQNTTENDPRPTPRTQS